MDVNWITTELPLFPHDPMVVMAESRPEWERLRYALDSEEFRVKAISFSEDEWSTVFRDLEQSGVLSYLWDNQIEIDWGDYEELSPEQLVMGARVFREAASRLPQGLARQWAEAVVGLAIDARTVGSGLAFFT